MARFPWSESLGWCGLIWLRSSRRCNETGKTGHGKAQPNESRERPHPERQQELDDIAARLAKFKPTRIAIEALSDRPDYSSQKYAEFTPEKLTTNPDERVQIAYRLAHRLGQKTVYGIDEQSDTIDYFPFDKVQASRRLITRPRRSIACRRR